MPTPEVAATVRDHHVHQVFSAYIGSGSFQLSKLDTLTLANAKGAVSGRSRVMPFGGRGLKNFVDIIWRTPPNSRNSRENKDLLNVSAIR